MREAEGELRSVGSGPCLVLRPPFSSLTRFRSIGADFETSRGVKTVDTFDKMGLREDLLRGIYEYGFDKPSAIQQRAVVPIIKGRDVIAQAQSGTGKTSMISLAVCQNIKTETRE